jgi:hypothetical protein
MSKKPNSDCMYYLQDSRQYVGNAILWWAKDGAGYTCSIEKAHVYTFAEAYNQHTERITDIPWPKDHVDARTKLIVDIQNVTHAEAIKGRGWKLKRPKKRRATTGKTRGNCPACGKITWDYNPHENAYCENHFAQYGCL